ncbi:hypothetical protein [Microbacterium enclense]|uniref:Uncharacterized protein n=1 Tax=Microbacterium enclense TaxID=993073 RepID=A0A1G6NVS4_9MICO|nr:hypothetical protein [Microbacterium enclense]KSU52911.1 hypothetical protein AS029_12955 [Microbacterium enclense]SDC72032.1 hypothetical protein SAMN05216418_2873 [Microbacterium enclense]
MLIGTIRPRETTTVDVEAHSLAEVHKVLQQRAPAGFELTDAPVRMSNGTTLLAAAGTFARRDGTRGIEAADMAALRAQVPDGWVLLHVRST